MARLLYFAFPTGPVHGGHKMILRHVETLRDLGFDALCVIGPQHVVPTWLEHSAPIVRHFEFRPDDVLVLPDDAHDTIGRTPKLGLRTVILVQGPYLMSALSLGALDSLPAENPPTFMTVGQGVADFVRRLYPAAAIEVVPCFADERRFRPAAAKQPVIVCMPKKRRFEVNAIRGLFRKLHPAHAGLAWRELLDRPEPEAAQALASAALHLSLARLEGLGIANLEAMASGAVCAGFLGRGGEEYATPDNGFWAPDDDLMAAADALAQAADLVRTGGAPLRRLLDAGHETAARWSYAHFRERLEATWMRLAPDARLRDGPLG
jgi:hypothetical protein